MKPNTTMKQILAELASDQPDRAQVAHLLVTLSEWVATGGALPERGPIQFDGDAVAKAIETYDDVLDTHNVNYDDVNVAGRKCITAIRTALLTPSPGVVMKWGIIMEWDDSGLTCRGWVQRVYENTMDDSMKFDSKADAEAFMAIHTPGYGRYVRAQVLALEVPS